MAKDKDNTGEACGDERPRSATFTVRFGEKEREFSTDDLRDGFGSIQEKVFEMADIGKGFGEQIRQTLTGNREKTVMVRIDNETKDQLDMLVEVGLFKSISEAGAFLLAEGLKARSGVVRAVREKVDAIRSLREEVRNLVETETRAESKPAKK